MKYLMGLILIVLTISFVFAACWLVWMLSVLVLIYVGLDVVSFGFDLCWIGSNVVSFGVH